MANQFTDSEKIFFEGVVEDFDPSNVHANQAEVRQASTEHFTKDGVQERRQSQFMVNTTEGRDVSSDTQDVKSLTVPVGISDDDIVNHVFELNSSELKNEYYRDNQVRAAVRKLSNKLDLRVTDKVVKEGSVVLTRTGEFSDYDALASAETEFQNREIDLSDPRCMNLNPRMSRKAASVIAARESGVQQQAAYEASMLPSVAGFETHKANVIASLAAAGGSSITVNGANQNKTLEVWSSSSTSSADNRYQTLTVNSTTNVAAGDAFTLPNVNSVGMISKSDTGSLQTFRVVSVDSGTTLTITPAIIPADSADLGQKAYANCTTTPANGAALTFINTDAAQPSTFFCKDSVEIFTTGCADPDLSSTLSVMRAQTDSGIEILFAKEADINDLSVKYRLSFMASAHVLENQRAGILLPGQNADVGG